MKTNIPTIAISILAATALASNAAVTITSSTPTSLDYFNGAYNTADKFYTDTLNLGQSFTTGSNAGGYSISNFALQFDRTNGTNTQSLTFAIRIIEINADNMTTSTVYRELGHSITGASWGVGDWLGVSLNDSFMLDPNKLYGIDLEMTFAGQWKDGIPYLRNNTSDVFAGGYRYQFADNDPTAITATTGQDLVFNIGVEAIPEPSTALMLGIAGVALLFRRGNRTPKHNECF